MSGRLSVPVLAVVGIAAVVLLDEIGDVPVVQHTLVFLAERAKDDQRRRIGGQNLLDGMDEATWDVSLGATQRTGGEADVLGVGLERGQGRRRAAVGDRLASGGQVSCA